MIYNTGTLSVSGNAATGTGTNFIAAASQVRAGQTLIVLSNPVQMFQISSVNSATSLTISPAASPALSGQKYGILVSDVVSLDGLAQSMSQLIKEYDENIGAWEALASTTVNQSITVTINGVSMTIPALGKLLQKSANGTLPVESGGTGAKDVPGARLALGWVNDALPVALGGTGGKTQAEARSGIGLGSAATLDAGTSSANVVTVESSGIGGASRGSASTNINTLSDRSCFLTASGSGPTGTLVNGFNVVHATNPTSYNTQMVFRSARAYLRSLEAGTYTAWHEFYTTNNTTKASDGTLKAASPVVKIFADGKSETNDESEGITVTRQSEGVYLIEGCMGLNSDAAWGGPDGGFDIPTDRNKQPLIWLDYKVCADGSVLVKTFHRTHPDAPNFARNERDSYASGDPIDIPAGQFVSVRVEMPLNSIWNQKQEVARMEAEDAERQAAIEATEQNQQNIQ